MLSSCSAFSALHTHISLPTYHYTARHYSSQLFSSRIPNQQQQHENADDDECLLIPESNPNSDPNATSRSGVRYTDVTAGIDKLYPPLELSNRNAKSRTDGYWKYIERGEKPPQEFTYGEFDIEFFGMLLDRTWEHYLEGFNKCEHDHDNDDNNSAKSVPYSKGQSSSDETEHTTRTPWNNKIFCDIGSGAGRLVLSAAALHPNWKLCRGVEILPNLHDLATNIADSCVSSDDGHKDHILRIPYKDQDMKISSDVKQRSNADKKHLPLAPIKFKCGSFTDPYEYLGDIDCAFVFSSCMKPNLVQQLSLAIGRQCKPGTIIITTEFPLFLRGTIHSSDEDETLPHGQYEIELLEKIDGWCWLMGGKSTAYVHRVKTSLWKEYAGPRERQQLSLEEDAYQLVQSIESGELTDTKAFLRRVSNDMIFHGVSTEFLPQIDDDDENEAAL